MRQAPVQYLRFLSLLIRVIANRYISHDLSGNGLEHGSIAGHNRFKILCFYIGRDKIHPAADIDAHCIWNDDAVRSDDSADRHSFSLVSIRHQARPFMDKWKLR